MADKQRKKCPNCGAAFDCCGESDCWCENVQVPTKSMKFIMLNYTDCLCPQCLQALSKTDKL